MYQIKEMAKLTELSIPTIRYYEELAILTPKRNQNGYREYTKHDLEWLQFVLRLKKTGMELKQIKRYSDLRAQGDTTILARIELLALQAEVLEAKKAELESHLAFLKQKQTIYHELLKKQRLE